jgi:hypothetical protein
MNDQQRTRPITYIPPSSEAMDQLAQKVCIHLKYDIETRLEFAAFMKLVGQMYAKHLSTD